MCSDKMKMCSESNFKMRIVFLVLVYCVGGSVTSTITSSPGLKRRHIADSCEFQWTVSGELTSYTIHNKSTGSPAALSADHSNHSIQLTTSTSTRHIRLFIWKIQLWDAGNYSLSVLQGTTTTIDAGALLFVYDNAGTSSVNHSGSLPAIEGRSVALSCAVVTRSRPSNPASLRPPVQYFWRLGRFGDLDVISGGGHPRSSTGQILTRYNMTNDGRTLVITSVQSSDRQQYSCWGREEGSRHTTALSTLYLAVNYRPIISKRQPKSGRSNGDTGQTVTFIFDIDAEPAVVLVPNWALRDSTGSSLTLPPQFQSLNFSNPFSVSFDLSSAAYYGRYSFDVSNSIGTTSDSFSVERPGRPDAPTDLTVLFKTFRLISVDWSCRWYNGRRQTSTLQLRDLESNAILDAFNRTETDGCYNETRSHLFQNNIQPDRDYEISLWSTNSLGSSDVIRTTVRTTKRFQLLLSPKTISVNASEAKINFETMYGNMAVLRVTCCAEETGACSSAEFRVDAASTQVVMRPLPTPGVVYLFDFTAHGKTAKGVTYYLGMIKGVRADKDGNPSDPLLTAVIVLGVLLAVTSLSLIGCLIAFAYYGLRRRRAAQGKSMKGQQMNSDLNELKPRKTEEKEQQRTTKEKQKPEKRPLPGIKLLRKVQDSPPKIPSPDDDIAQERYEAMDRQDEDTEGLTYTPLDQPPPPAARNKKRNHYS